MSCVSGLVGSIYVVRWRSPELVDLPAIQAGVVGAHRQVGRGLSYLAIIPQDCPAPSSEIRSEMARSMDVLLEHCDRLYFVIEGSGFKHSMLRSVLAGILLVSSKRGRCTVHTTVHEAVTLIAKATRVDAGATLRAARARDLIL